MEPQISPILLFLLPPTLLLPHPPIHPNLFLKPQVAYPSRYVPTSLLTLASSPWEFACPDAPGLKNLTTMVAFSQEQSPASDPRLRPANLDLITPTDPPLISPARQPNSHSSTILRLRRVAREQVASLQVKLLHSKYTPPHLNPHPLYLLRLPLLHLRRMLKMPPAKFPGPPSAS